MKISFKSYPSMILVAAGMLVVIYALYGLLHGITIATVALLALGIMLMIVGVLFKYTQEIETVEEGIEHPKGEEMSYWRMQDMEYRLKKVEGGERSKQSVPSKTEKISDDEFNEFKVIADDMLGKLEPEHIEKFQKSEHFETYEKVMCEDRIDDKLKKKFIQTVDELLEKLPKEEVNKFVKEAEKYSFYQKIIDWSKK